MKLLLDFYFTFAKIGLFTIGGGITMFPLMQKELVEKKNWLNETELLDYFTIAQSVPGIIAVNSAILVAYKHRKSLGALFAALGLITPSFLIIVLLASLLSLVQGSRILASAFTGISAAVVALLFNTVLKIGKKTIVNIRSAILAIASFLLVFAFGVSPVIIILSALVLALGWSVIKLKKAPGK